MSRITRTVARRPSAFLADIAGIASLALMLAGALHLPTIF